MSALTQQKQVTILLVAVVVLLAAIIGILIWQSNTVPAPTVDANQGTQSSAMNVAPTDQAPAAPDFDPAAAPTVAEGETPEQYVTRYYELCQSGEYESAFPMLPASTQANSYGDAASFAQQLEGYGITGYTVSEQVEQDGTVYVTGTQETPQMPISYTWTFVQAEDGSWLCAGRQMGGM